MHFTGYNVFGLGFEINPAAFYLGILETSESYIYWQHRFL